MRLTVLILTLVYAIIAGAIQLEYGCRERDPCLKAVIGRRFPNRNGRADCSSFLLATVTPAPKTVSVTERTTTTIFITRHQGHYRDVKARQVTVVPSNIPVYALAACSGAARYSSACSCIGVRPSTTTLPTPTITVTVTKTRTKRCVVECKTRCNFY
ncbi:hypothetical protein TWF481_008038 [Arthrobotrys musiformis]|uniref:Uncharacterized protein n=1 Tax=Arthrobotrys musiformis TaxID=47236 RepID=A0AAV9W801_9PEZI